MLEKLFGIKRKQASIKSEIIGGLITFIAMCYILPVNSAILSDMGMDKTGVFVMTAIVSFIVTMIMGAVANYPIVLSAGMGLNAFLAYTLSDAMGFSSWHQKMILLTIAGVIFFALSLTPLRKIIIEAIPKDLKCIISASLGGFIMFVGLRNSGIIGDGSTLVELGNLGDPAILIGLVAVVITVGFMFSKNKVLSTMAIPFGILIAAVIGIVTSEILVSTGHLAIFQDSYGVDYWGYKFWDGQVLHQVKTALPIAPWRDNSVLAMFNPVNTFGQIKEVFAFGLLGSGDMIQNTEGVKELVPYTASTFGNDIITVLANPATYVAIFSLMFVNLFDTTATLIAVGEKTGIIDENGKMQNYRRAVLADATGALICAPLGTSTVTSFAESNVGIAMGAKTGLSAVVAAFMFLLSIFIYPVFSIFTAGSVTVPALVCVGLLIMIGGFKGLNFKDPVVAFTSIIMVVFSVLCYSISNGIGIGLIAYCVMMLFSKRGKEVSVPIYVIAALFIVSFAATTVIKFI